MEERETTNVVAAFEMLLEEVEAEIDTASSAGSTAFEARDLERVKAAVGRVEQLTAFREKLSSLRKVWTEELSPRTDVDEDQLSADRRNLGRLQRGLRTPEETYYTPLLKALVDMGGAAKVGDVMTRVETAMRGVLRDLDFEPLASSPENPRWRNAVQWARHQLVKEGLLKSNSPRGVWEISDLGRQYLRK